MVIILGKTGREAWDHFEPYHSGFKPFRDATMGVCTYKCTVLDCLQGLEYGIKMGWYDYKTFNYNPFDDLAKNSINKQELEEYEVMFQQPQ